MSCGLASTIAQVLILISATDRPPDYLEVGNQTGQVQWVYLQARGGDAPDAEWQPGIRSNPNRTTKIRLRNFEPFDILILGADGTYTKIDGVMLCTMIDQCRDLGIKQSTLQIKRGQWTMNQQREFRLQEPAEESSLTAGADYDLVRIEVPRPRRKK